MMTNSQTFNSAAPGHGPALAGIARMFNSLVAFIGARVGRPTTKAGRPRVRLSRAEAFRQVQREKWLGVRAVNVGELQSARPGEPSR